MSREKSGPHGSDRTSAIAVPLLLLPIVVFGGILLAGGSGGSVDPALGAEPPDLAPHVPGEVLVRFDDAASSRERRGIRSALGARTTRRFRGSVELLRLDSGRTTREALAAFERNPFVRYAEPNYIVKADELPDDPRLPELYGLRNTGQTGGLGGADIEAELAWEVTNGSRDVVVAVIDTGIDHRHPDLADNIWTNPHEIPANGVDDDGNGYVDDIRGWDFANGDNDPYDDNSHGTHVAGTIGAIGDNAEGVVGVSWKVGLIPLKFLRRDGTGTVADAIAALDYAVAAGADIANNSWGGAAFSQALFDSIQAAAAAELLFVASAGNDGIDTDQFAHYPSGYEAINVVSVAATNHDDLIAGFSNFGRATVDLAAPGVDTLSTIPGERYSVKSGTSMAAPHVSGAAALIRSVTPYLGVRELKALLLEGVVPLPGLTAITVTGGRLSAFRPVADPDHTPPGIVDDLEVDGTTSNSLQLRWTATGDDGEDGRAVRYELRFGPSPLDEGSFAAATRFSATPRPAASGSPETVEVTGLDPLTTYFFALRAIDEWGNPGPLGNSTSGTTRPPPRFESSPGAFELELFPAQTTTRELRILNSGAGTLDWRIVAPDPDDADAANRWLRTEPSAGRLHEDESEPITLTVDSTGIDPGTIVGTVDVATNDPDKPLVPHAVTLVVSSAPAIRFTPARLDFGEVFVGSSRTFTLELRNVGTRPVNSMLVAAPHPSVTVGSAPVALEIGEAAVLAVTFAPSTAGLLDSALVIAGDAGPAPLHVELQGVATFPPEIRVDPVAFDEVLSTGQSSTRHLTITNPGGSPLQVSVFFQHAPGAPEAVSSLLTDGSFESGDFTRWEATTNHLAQTTPWSVSTAGGGWFGNSAPPEGRYDAFNGFDGEAGLRYDLSRTLHIPAGSHHAELSYLDRIQFDSLGRTSSLPRIYQAAVESLDGTVLVEFLREEIRLDGMGYTDLGWRRRRVNLAPFAGQTVRLHIQESIPESYTGPAVIELDDFRLEVAGFPEWLSVTPAVASIPPGESVELELRFEAGGSGSARLEGMLRIETNIPELNELNLATVLTVDAAPDIAIIGAPVVVESLRLFADPGATTLHELALPAQAAAGAELSVVVDGDFDFPIEFASVSAEGVDLGTLGRSGPECAPVQSEFAIDPAQMSSLATDGRVEVRVENSEFVDSICQINRHIVRLRYFPSAELIDFGTVFVGRDAETEILIRNIGTDPLQVGSIASDNPQFVPSLGGSGIAPGQTEVLRITFVPAETGLVSGMLGITSNDPDSPLLEIELSGAGAESPQIEVTPAALDAALPIGGQRIRTLTISNHGGGPLEFGLTLDRPAPGNSAALFELLNPAPTALTCLVADPERGQLYGQENRGRGFYRYDAARDAWTRLADSPIDAPNNCGAALLGGRLFTAYTTDPRLGVYDIGADGWSTVSAPVGYTGNLASDGETWLYQADVRAAARLDPLTLTTQTLAAPPFSFQRWSGLRHLDGRLYGHQGNGFDGFASYEIAGDSWTVLPKLPQGAVLGAALDPLNRAYYAYGPSGGRSLYRYSIDDGEWSTLIIPFLVVDDGGLAWLPDGIYLVEGQAGAGFARMRSAPPPLRVEPGSGIVPPFGTLDVSVVLDATGVVPGELRAEIVVASNDPSTPRVVIPVEVDVSGVPDLVVSGDIVTLESSADFDEAGASTVHELRVSGSPSGAGRLELVATGDFGDRGETAVVSAEGMPLGSVGNTGGRCAAVSATFSVEPEALAALAADGVVDLEVANSNVVEPFCEVNEHTVRLTYDMPADRLDFGNVVIGAAHERAIVIHNSGSALLRLASISTDTTEFSAPLAAFDVAPGAARRVPIAFEPGAEGAYAAALTLTSNDPDTPARIVPLEGRGISPPAIVAAPDRLDLTLTTGAVESRTLELRNTGSGPLEFSLDVDAAMPGLLMTAPVTGVVPPTGSLAVNLVFDTREIRAGEHGAEIRVASNDPGLPLLVVPVTVNVLAIPRMAVHGREIAIESVRDYYASGALTLHDLPVAVPPVGGGRFELTIAGDYGATDETAVLVAEGAVVGWQGETRRDCDPFTVTFPVPADELASLVADRVVALAVENSPSVETFCRVNRHSVRLVYGEQLDVLDFGATFVHGEALRSFVIENTGTAELTIAAVASDTEHFVPSLSSTSLDPGETATVEVSFRPSGAVAFAGSLGLVSNDPAAPRVEIPLLGVGTAAPSIEVAPAAVEVTSGPEEQRVIELQLSNPGGASLAYSLIVIAAGPEFISAGVSAGTLPPSATTTVALTIDAADLDIGTHDAAIEIHSNDPRRPVVSIPVRLDVVGAPDIRLADSAILLRSILVYSTSAATTLHRFSVPGATVGGATVELIVDGDYGDLDETAFASVDGSPLGTSGSSRFDCTRSTRVFAVGATDLAAFAADGEVEVEVRNTADVGTPCVSNLHEVRLRYSEPLDRLDFDAVRLGSAAFRNVVVHNVGTDRLRVLSIGSDLPELTLSASSLDIAPGGSRALTVRFQPVAAAASAGTLTLISDDPDMPVLALSVSGAGAHAPALSLVPESHDVRVAAGESATRTLTLLNAGGLPLEFALEPDASAAWLSVVPLVGSITPGSSAEVTVAIDAAALLAGRFASVIGVTTNDPLRNHVEFPVVAEVTGTPELAFGGGATQLDFGTVFVGTARELALSVENRGTDRLELGPITSSSPEFVPSSETLAIAPQETGILTLGFAAPAAGLFEGLLTIASNDPRAPLSSLVLRATGAEPPVIDLEPQVFELSVPLGGTVNRVLRIVNGGNSPLEFDLSTFARPSATGSLREGLESELESLAPSPVPLICVVGDPADGRIYAQSSPGTAFYRYSPASDTWTELSHSPLDSGESCGTALLDGKVYTSYAAQTQLGVYDIASGGWATLSSPLGGTANIASDGQSRLFLVRSRHGRGLDPVTGSTTALRSPPFAFSQAGGLRHLDGQLFGHRGLDNTEFAAYDIDGNTWTPLPDLPGGAELGAAIDPVGRHYFAYGSRGGHDLYRYSIDAATWEVLTLPIPVDRGGMAWLAGPPSAIYLAQGGTGTEFVRLVQRPGYLSLDPELGVVAPGQARDVSVRLDSAGLSAGLHESTIVVTSNDPERGTSSVPVALQVLDAPNIHIVPAASGEFGPVLVGAERELSFTLENTGTRQLEIESITSDLPELSPSRSAVTLPAGGSQTLAIVFRPSGIGPFAGTLSITSNDPDAPVLAIPLTGQGVTPPAIDVQPTAIEAVLHQGSRTTRTLTIANDGGGPLDITLSLTPVGITFVELDTAAGLVPGAGRLRVELGLSAEGIAPGAHEAIVSIASSDPERPLVETPVSLVVLAAPDLDVLGEAVEVESFRNYAPLGGRTEHRLLTPVPPVGPGLLEIVAEGDYGAPTETASVTVEGLLLGEVGGVGPDCSPASNGFAIDAVTMLQLVEDGRVDVAVRNGDEVDAQCPANLHTVRLLYDAAADLAFGDVFLDRVGERTITLFNVGSAELSIESITASSGEFVPAVTALTLPAGSHEPVTIGFTPPGDGPWQDVLTIVSNDPDTPRLELALSGTGLAPPSVELDPAALTLAVSAGEQDRRTLSLSNPGSSPLEFEIRTVSIPPAQTAVVFVSPAQGTVAPGDSVRLTAAFDATGLQPGVFDLPVTIRTNVPDRPELVVPVRLEVPGPPDIVVQGESLVLQSVREYIEAGGRTAHALPVTRVPAGGATVEIIALGDYGLADETATVWAEGILLGSVGGVGPDCTPATGRFPIAPRELAALAADGVVDIEVQNSPEVNVFCTPDRHTIRLSYDTSLERIEFGSVFTGFSRVQPITIRNDGVGDLHVRLSSDEAAIGVVSETITLPVSASAVVPVVYSPAAAGALAATLNIASDDLGEPLITVDLEGRAVGPPVFDLLAEPIAAALPPRDARVESSTIGVNNLGSSDLLWSAATVEVFESVAAADVWVERPKGDESLNGAGGIAADRSGGPDGFGYRFRDSDDPEGPIFEWLELPSAGTSAGSSADDETWGPVPLGFDFPFYGFSFPAVHISSNGWLSLTSDKTSFSNPDSLPNGGFSVPENLIAPFWDDLIVREPAAIRYGGDEHYFVVQYTGVERLAPGSVLTFQVVLFPSGQILFQYLTMNGTLDSATIGLQNDDKSVGLLVAYNESYVHDRLAVELIPTAGWADADPRAGAIPPGGSAGIDVRLSAAGLDEGDYRAQIELRSNDPFRQQLVVPVTLHVGEVQLDILDIEPHTLNLASNGGTVRARIQLPAELDPHDVVVSTVSIDDVLFADPSGASFTDENHDGVEELILRFDREALQRMVPSGSREFVLTVTGRVADTVWFTGTYALRVVEPRGRAQEGRDRR